MADDEKRSRRELYEDSLAQVRGLQRRQRRKDARNQPGDGRDQARRFQRRGRRRKADSQEERGTPVFWYNAKDEEYLTLSVKGLLSAGDRRPAPDYLETPPVPGTLMAIADTRFRVQSWTYRYETRFGLCIFMVMVPVAVAKAETD